MAKIEQFVDHPHYLTQPLGGDTFLMCLSGLGVLGFKGQGSTWHRESVEMFVDLRKALEVTGRQKPDYVLNFALQQWTVLVTPNSFSDVSSAVNFGIAVDTFNVDWRNGDPHPDVRVLFDVAVNDVDAVLHLIAYQLILVGNVVQLSIPRP